MFLIVSRNYGVWCTPFFLVKNAQDRLAIPSLIVMRGLKSRGSESWIKFQNWGRYVKLGSGKIWETMFKMANTCTNSKKLGICQKWKIFPEQQLWKSLTIFAKFQTFLRSSNCNKFFRDFSSVNNFYRYLVPYYFLVSGEMLLTAPEGAENFLH